MGGTISGSETVSGHQISSHGHHLCDLSCAQLICCINGETQAKLLVVGQALAPQQLEQVLVGQPVIAR